MTLWIDNKFEPISHDFIWADNAIDAITAIVAGWPIDRIDTDDDPQVVKLFEWLESENMITHYTYNIHGYRIDPTARKKISEILNRHMVNVTYKIPLPSQLKLDTTPEEEKPKLDLINGGGIEL